MMRTFPSGGMVWNSIDDAEEGDINKSFWMQWWDRETMQYILLSDKPFLSGPHTMEEGHIFPVDEIAILMYVSYYESCMRDRKMRE